MKENQELHQNEKPEISLAEIFNLNDEIKEGLHPYALHRFNDLIAEIFNEVPQISQLTIDEINIDINKYLDDDDKVQIDKYKRNILEGLRKCTNIGSGYSPYPNVHWVTSDMSGLTRLVKTVYERKEEKIKEEEDKLEKDKQWKNAISHVYPLQLSKDANQYLNSDEKTEFLDSVFVAARVYLKEGDSYLNSYKTFDYRWWLNQIQHRKKEEQKYNNALAQAQAFSSRLDQGLKELKKRLSPKKEDPLDRFKTWYSRNNEKRYLGESFSDILIYVKNTKWTQGYIPAAEKTFKHISLKNSKISS